MHSINAWVFPLAQYIQPNSDALLEIEFSLNCIANKAPSDSIRRNVLLWLELHTNRPPAPKHYRFLYFPLLRTMFDKLNPLTDIDELGLPRTEPPRAQH